MLPGLSCGSFYGLFYGLFQGVFCGVFRVFLLTSLVVCLPVQAQSIEAEGSAVVGKSGPGAARQQAIKEAMAVAALKAAALVKYEGHLENSAMARDNLQVQAAAKISDVVVLDEWLDHEGEILTVRISAKVASRQVENLSKSVRYRRKAAITQFQVLDRTQIHDMPDIEVLVSKALLGRLEQTNTVLATDASNYLLSESDKPYLDLGMDQAQIMAELATHWGVQFVISGRIKDMGVTAHPLTVTLRHVELEFELWDGVSGLLLNRHRLNASVWVDRPFDFPGSLPALADKFFASPIGQQINKILDEATLRLSRDMAGLPFTGRLVRKQGSQVFMDSGGVAGVKVGDRFEVFRTSDAVFGGNSKLFLGYGEQPSTTVLITSVQPGFAVGLLEQEPSRVKPGDFLRAVSGSSDAKGLAGAGFNEFP